MSLRPSASRDQPLGLDRYLTVAVDPLLPESLISPGAQIQLRELARQIPGPLTEFFGFESRLAEPEGQVDLLVCVKGDTPGRDVLADASAAGCSLSLPVGPVWDDLLAFAQAWRRPGESLDKHIQNLWLEFDLPPLDDGVSAPAASVSHQPQLPLPALFFGSNALHGGQLAPDWLTDEALALCRGGPLPAALARALNRVLQELPPQANIFQLGMMRSRPALENALRVCLRGLSRPDTAALVTSLGWDGPVESLDAVWRWASESAMQVDVDIDLLPELGPKLGLECSFGWGRDAHGRLERFLARLVEQDLCTEAKRQGLLAWTRAFHQRAQTELWPTELVTRAAAMEPQAVSMFIRSVYHIKLVIQPKQAIEAKAYLAVFHGWMTADLMQRVKSYTLDSGSTP